MQSSFVLKKKYRSATITIIPVLVAARGGQLMGTWGYRFAGDRWVVLVGACVDLGAHTQAGKVSVGISPCAWFWVGWVKRRGGESPRLA